MKRRAIEINMFTFNLIGFTFRSRESRPLVSIIYSLFFTGAFSYHSLLSVVSVIVNASWLMLTFCVIFGVSVRVCVESFTYKLKSDLGFYCRFY